MSLDEKLTAFFSNRFNLKKPAEPTHLTHIYADYVELIALVNSDSFVTISDIIDRFNDECINIIEHYKSKEQTENYYFKQKYDAEIGSEEPIKDDLKYSYVVNLFAIIKDRAFLYDDIYPFELENDNLKTKSTLNEHNLLYIATLLCSSLNTFKTFNHILTAEFEEISANALASYLGEKAKVKQFGKKSAYNGNAKENIMALAGDMFVEVNKKNLVKIPDTNQQERGLDIAAWFPFKDLFANMLVLLFQCACGKDWIKKQDDVKRYEKYLVFNFIKPIYGMCIPYGVITDFLEIHQSDDILVDGLLFDRNRIIGYNEDLKFFKELDSYKIAQAIINYSEDIV